MSAAKSRASWNALGYAFTNYGQCRSCKKDIEWWLTASKKPTPMSVLPTGELVSHFVDCPDREAYRRATARHKARTEKPVPKTGSLF